MGDIINYTVDQFLKKDIELINEYIIILANIKPKDSKLKVFELSLRQVQDIKDHLAEGNIGNLIEAVCIVEDKREDQLNSIKIVDFFAIVNSIVEQIKEINKLEVNSLSSSTPNFKWEAVNGGERMAKFGIYNTLDRLSGGDITKYEQILDLPYADVFTKLYMETVKGELEYEMNAIKTQH